MPKIKRESRQFIVIDEERLITEVQNRPILYDKALKGYRKPAIREGAWQEVANLLQNSGNSYGFLICIHTGLEWCCVVGVGLVVIHVFCASGWFVFEWLLYDHLVKFIVQLQNRKKISSIIFCYGCCCC